MIFAVNFNHTLLKIEKIYQHLKKYCYTVSVAESCTGGLLSYYLTSLSGSSNYFKSGLITYSDEAKISILEVEPQLIYQFTAVSHEVCEAMASQCQILSRSDIGVSITGYADYYNTIEDQGMAFIGIKLHDFQVKSYQKFYNSGRHQNRIEIVEDAIDLLTNLLL